MSVLSKFNIVNNSVHVISLSCNQVPPVRYGGIELVVANICKGLSDLGVNVICYSPGEFSIKGVDHFKTISKPNEYFKDGGVPNSDEHLSAVLLGLKKFVKIGDIIIFNHSDHFRYLKKRLGWIFSLKVKFFEIAHCRDAGLYNNIIYPSKSLKKQINKPGVVIPHGEQLLFVDKDMKRENHLFYAGQINKDKGVDIALEFCRSIGCRLRIAGPLTNNDFELDIISDPLVDYLGELTYPELFEEYKIAKAFIYMTQINEPFGLVTIEAMAAGCPVITTGFGGTGETVLDGVTGYFCKNIAEINDSYFKCNEILFSDCVNRSKQYSVEAMAKAYLSYLTIGNKRTLFNICA